MDQKGLYRLRYLTNLLFSSSAVPSCVSYARSSSLEDFRIQYSLACGSFGGVIPARYLPTSGKEKESDVPASRTSEGMSAPSQRSVLPRQLTYKTILRP